MSSPSKKWSVLFGATLLIAVLGLSGRYPAFVVAHNDHCVTHSGEWRCTWLDREVPITSPHWFNAEVKVHDWTYVAISDGRGGAVVQKCVHAMRDNDGYLEPEVCGPGIKDGFVKPYMRPGYLYTRYDASPTTLITGHGMYD